MSRNDVQPQYNAGGECMLRERDLAARWNVSARTLQRWRAAGSGPPWHHFAGSVRYKLGDILNFEHQAKREGSAP